MTQTQTDVANAAAKLVAAFASHNRAEYFACFAPDATFVFHTTPAVLKSRAAFEEEWDRWEEEDAFHVLSCDSREQIVQELGTDAAVFIHRVATKASFGGELLETEERETIVFRREPDGQWLAVHEHLSPAP